MERRLLIRIGMLACLLVMTAMGGTLWAGGAQSGFEPPPAGAIITGPEIWGVVTLYCNPGAGTFATIRLKRVDDCNVETLSYVDLNWNYNLCPESAGSFDEGVRVDSLQPRLENEWGVTGNPFISKVKNFDRQFEQATGIAVTSFDAMIKFWTQ
jgi:hypothetical protein